jgi:uncharacterized protein
MRHSLLLSERIKCNLIKNGDEGKGIFVLFFYWYKNFKAYIRPTKEKKKMTLTVEHDEKNKQFVAIAEGKACTLEYSVLPDGKTLDYYSTFVPPELRGRHIGQNIVKFALDFAKENDYKIIPSCPFVKLYIDRHPEYRNIT